jgi:hypothetical protein
MKKLAIIGAGGHGKVVADLASLLGWESISFFDAAWKDKSSDPRWPMLGDTSAFMEKSNEFDGVLIAIGNCEFRWIEFSKIKICLRRQRSTTIIFLAEIISIKKRDSHF